MSLVTVAETIAEQIRRQEYIELLAHHDADGIAAGSILCHAMLRAGIRFRIRVRHEVTPADLIGSGDAALLLCDLGAGMADLPKDTIVVDHHLPVFEGVFHANPRLEGADGDRELSSAGMAYIIAQKMGDNRDLAGLVIPGIIGDDQEMTGKNLEIFNDGIANGIIIPDRGITLPGRDMAERWYMATSPYLSGISGTEERIADIIEQAQDQTRGENSSRIDVLLSQVVLEAAPDAAYTSLLAIYGDTYHLQREVIEDAHALTAVIDACGKAGQGDLAVTVCMRSSHYLEQVWEIARQHRMKVIDGVKNAHPDEGLTGVYEVRDMTVAGDVADILARDRMTSRPVLVYAPAGDSCRISIRCPAGITTDIGPLVRELAAACGGNGGGHIHRAVAVIPSEKIGIFSRNWQEAFAL
jgi:single-stranded-DNA-specific exonuclease